MGFPATSMSCATASLIFSFVFLPQLGWTLSQEANFNVSAVFVFGDSLADAGTNNFIHGTPRANFPPYGETFFHSPTGRFTDGRTIFDFIAAYLKIPFPPPFLQSGADISRGINFASAGSGLLDSTGIQIKIVPFGHQVQQFMHFSHNLAKSRGREAARRFLREAVFTASIGSNDITTNYLVNDTLRNSTTPQDFISLLLDKYQAYVLRLYHGGARKMVLLDIPAIGCIPIAKFSALATFKGGCFEPANQMAVAYNAKMKMLVYHMNKALREATILYINSYDLVMDIIQNPKSYGFRNSRDACCGGGTFNAAVSCGKEDLEGVKYKPFLCKEPSEYVFWDGMHPTERLNYVVASKVWEGNTSVMYPFNLKTLIQRPRS